MNADGQKLRIDKWLWQARFFKTRSISAKVVTGGHLRVNGAKISKASHMVTPGDVLTFPQARQIKVVKIVALGVRRGPAPEAQTLYEDLSAPSEPSAKSQENRVGGRPTKRDRRNLDTLKSRPLED